MTFTRSIVASVFLIGIVVGAGLASAQELPATREAALYSITHGFRETSLPLLRRQGVGDFDAARRFSKSSALPPARTSTGEPAIRLSLPTRIGP